MSRRTEAKRARRKKRQTARDANSLPAEVFDDEADATIDLDDLDDVDALLTEHGWTFDSENSDDRLVTWFYPPSGVDLDDPSIEAVTRMWMTAEDDGEAVHVMLVGTPAEISFAPGEFFESLDVIEAYRSGAPAPTFD